jgi:hypothetical protein
MKWLRVIKHNPTVDIEGTSTVFILGDISEVRERINIGGGSHKKGDIIGYEVRIEKRLYEQLFGS